MRRDAGILEQARWTAIEPHGRPGFAFPRTQEGVAEEPGTWLRCGGHADWDDERVCGRSRTAPRPDFARAQTINATAPQPVTTRSIGANRSFSRSFPPPPCRADSRWSSGEKSGCAGLRRARCVRPIAPQRGATGGACGSQRRRSECTAGEGRPPALRSVVVGNAVDAHLVLDLALALALVLVLW